MLTLFKLVAVFVILRVSALSATARSCNSLLCSDTIESHCPHGQYLSSDCACSMCPVVPATSAYEKWKLNCLTKELKVCPNANDPPVQCDDLLCSDPGITCRSAAVHYPDSACVCVSCPGPESKNKRLLTCLTQNKFCPDSITPSTTSAMEVQLAQNCSGRELMHCGNCSEDLHYPNGSCRACPAVRAANRPSHCDQTGTITKIVVVSVVVLTFIAVIIFVVVFFFKCNIKGCFSKRPSSNANSTATNNTEIFIQSNGQNRCTVCHKPVQDSNSMPGANYCKCSNPGRLSPEEAQTLVAENA
ncbi:hypothetical protein BOX15_Mlig020670g1 [Macrostomum lignano]|uniref:TNFR-Cys domain-containing protein n=1 Tax=Macrostomum lignano TaxID=282301 RepID=A0A267H7Q6_9PLAT|nr:hypothetical protein BOX15_Mlig020670g1 [Macrostomum lignano]